MKKKKNGIFQSIFKQKKDNVLFGKSVLITGATQKISVQTAKQFAKAGCKILLTDSDDDQLEKVKQNLADYTRHPIETFVVNPANKRAVQQLASHIAVNDSIDILINNTGDNSSLDNDSSPAGLQKLIMSNLWQPLYFTYAFLPLFKEQKYGTIVHVCAGQSALKLPDFGINMAIKAAIGMLSELQQLDAQEYDVNIATMYPFGLDTAMPTSNDLKSKVATALAPIYVQKPKRVAKNILKMVEKGRHAELAPLWQSVTRGLPFLGPVTNAISKTINFSIQKQVEGEDSIDWEEDIVDPFKEKLQDFSQMLEGMAYASIGELGFRLDEKMSGSYQWADKPDQSLDMTVHLNWGADSLLTWLNPMKEDFMTNYLEGTVSIEGLCESVACYGKLELLYFKEQKVRYSFDFEVDEQVYTFIGEKQDIYPWNLAWLNTPCEGEIRLLGDLEVVANATINFQFKDLPKLLKSWEWLK